jgi:hypothetical protein
MARALESVGQRRFTVVEYHRMAETGILSPDERLELLWGVVHPVRFLSKRRPSFPLTGS